jgi:hypothetical protein
LTIVINKKEDADETCLSTSQKLVMKEILKKAHEIMSDKNRIEFLQTASMNDFL